MLQACDEVCGKKKGRKNHGDTWWWNGEVKEAIQQKEKGIKKDVQKSIKEKQG